MYSCTVCVRWFLGISTISWHSFLPPCCHSYHLDKLNMVTWQCLGYLLSLKNSKGIVCLGYQILWHSKLPVTPHPFLKWGHPLTSIWFSIALPNRQAEEGKGSESRKWEGRTFFSFLAYYLQRKYWMSLFRAPGLHSSRRLHGASPSMTSVLFTLSNANLKAVFFKACSRSYCTKITRVFVKMHIPGLDPRLTKSGNRD